MKRAIEVSIPEGRFCFFTSNGLPCQFMAHLKNGKPICTLFPNEPEALEPACNGCEDSRNCHLYVKCKTCQEANNG